MTEVVNMAEKDTWDRKIDRTTRFGNPFRMEEDGGQYTREECIAAYRGWFLTKIQTDPGFREAVEELAGKTLGCWCKPEPCHGDVIVEYLDGDMNR